VKLYLTTEDIVTVPHFISMPKGHWPEIEAPSGLRNTLTRQGRRNDFLEPAAVVMQQMERGMERILRAIQRCIGMIRKRV